MAIAGSLLPECERECEIESTMTVTVCFLLLLVLLVYELLISLRLFFASPLRLFSASTLRPCTYPSVCHHPTTHPSPFLPFEIEHSLYKVYWNPPFLPSFQFFPSSESGRATFCVLTVQPPRVFNVPGRMWWNMCQCPQTLLKLWFWISSFRIYRSSTESKYTHHPIHTTPLT